MWSLPPIGRINTQKNKTNAPKMKRILYPPIAKSQKENNQHLMLGACIQDKPYEDYRDEMKELAVIEKLGPHSSTAIAPSRVLVAKDAMINYYAEYKRLTRHKQMDCPRFPCVEVLKETEKRRLLPCCLGLVKAAGDPNVLNLNHYNLGDSYICAASAGLRDAKLIQRCLFSHNRITDLGLAKLALALSPEICELDLSFNLITRPDPKLLLLLASDDSRLETISLEKNRFKNTALYPCLAAAQQSKHLKSLNIRSNNLTVRAVPHLVQLITNAAVLQQLYIGNNNVKEGSAVLNALSRNKVMKVFDYSCNDLGEEGMINAKAIAECFRNNHTLVHIDLSENYFGREAVQQMADGLEGNKSIYGVHLRGSKGYVDAKGFLKVDEDKEVHSHIEGKFKGLEVVSHRRGTGSQPTQMKHVCWICEGWYEQEFKYTFDRSRAPTRSHASSKQSLPDPASPQNHLLYIHFDFENYQPRLINLNENHVRYTTMVPPNKYRYYFTTATGFILEPNAPTEDLILHQGQIKCVNVRSGSAKPLFNHWNQLLVKTLPRTLGLVTKKVKETWTYDKSIWHREWKLDDQELLKKCFERDWKHSKIANLVKNVSDQDCVRELLWKHYAMIKNLYRQYSSWSPFGEIWGVSTNPFTEFCQASKIVSKDTPLKIIDLTFITTNSMSSGDWKGNALVPERGLVRFQFMEALVRLAEEKFKKNGLVTTFAEAVLPLLRDYVSPLLRDDVLPLPSALDSWRKRCYFVENIDILLKRFRPIFTYIYKRNSKMRVKPGEKPFMCLTQFKSLIEKTVLSTYVVERDILLSFNCSMMTQVDQIQSQRFLKMTQIQFIQAVARCAYILPQTCCIDPSVTDVLFCYKLEWTIHELKNTFCNEQIKNQFSISQNMSIFDVKED